ncbi:ATP synthase subunit I [Aestuariibacter sp. AA17]|uniref:ATP synthase subunit I n=1 Tax=Fluctibacter corallii TaxID=2984329 RepID=A0ABT3ADY0_9ALTE|nr:ATP synthase subunit I [Aestuariibacter sp. AA17]MCV2886522.1 ATP synthase subunit I [Aestuariibacter sp. AA17]
MANILAQSGRQLAAKVIVFQSLIAGLFALFEFIQNGEISGVSAICGAIICILPNTIFARFAFLHSGASQNQQVVRSFNKGAKLKLLLTMILFVVAFKFLPIEPLTVLIAYALTTASQWVAMLMFRHNN